MILNLIKNILIIINLNFYPFLDQPEKFEAHPEKRRDDLYSNLLI